MAIMEKIIGGAGTQGGPGRTANRPSRARHPHVPTRQLALTESLRAQQIMKGLFVEVAGVKYALPIDSWEERDTFLGVKMWRPGIDGLPERVGVKRNAPGTKWQTKLLAWLRDNVHQDIPPLYYRATLGHDLHVSTWGDLYAKHWHVGWASPFDSGAGESVRVAMDSEFGTFFDTHWGVAGNGEQGTGNRELPAHALSGGKCRLGAGCPADSDRTRDEWLAHLQGLRGFTENLGWVSGAKVTDAFVSEEIDELVSTTGTEYADFDYHEVGTSSTAENNNDTALVATTSIARATGTPTDADPIYRSVATITADASETWQEHGIFNNSTSVALMDRNLTGGQAVVSTDQVQYTYELTKNPEA